jgi:predicted phosphodiesterase
MRLALVSDIHGNLTALQAVLADIARRGVKCIVNLGDSLSGPLLPQETAELLMAQNWLQISGNHDRQILEVDAQHGGASDRYARSVLSEAVLAWLARLPKVERLGTEVLFCHGTPLSDSEYLMETLGCDLFRAATIDEVSERIGVESIVTSGVKVIACGHSHIPRALRTATDILVVNPGSVGLQAYFAELPFAHAVEMGDALARYAIIEKLGGQWQAHLLAVPYAHQSAADLAQQCGRQDWVAALLSGRIQ